MVGAIIKVFPGVPGGEEGNRIGAVDIKGSGQGIRVRHTAGLARVATIECVIDGVDEGTIDGVEVGEVEGETVGATG